MPAPRITTSQTLLPVLLLSVSLVGFFLFQTSVLIGDHRSLVITRGQQDKPLEQAEKLKAQLTGLASGTLKLAQQGDKNAQNIIDQLKKAGVNVLDQPAPAATGSSTPKASAPAAK